MPQHFVTEREGGEGTSGSLVRLFEHLSLTENQKCKSSKYHIIIYNIYIIQLNFNYLLPLKFPSGVHLRWLHWESVPVNG